VCEHCSHRFPATFAAATPSDPEILVREPVVEPKSAETKIPEAPVAPAAPFTPRAAAVAASPPPFGPLGERSEQPARGRQDSPAGTPPPFAPGAAADAPKTGKQSLNDWWKSQSPKRQWTFLGCFAVIIGAVIVSLPAGEATASDSKAEDKSAVATTTEPAKTTAETAKPATDGVKVESKKSESAIDESLGLLCQETPALGGKIEQPLAAAVAVEGKGFIARGAKVFADLHNAGGSTARWVVVTPTKRYKVTGIKFHADFPAEKLKALAAKGAQKEMLELIKTAERSDLALIETAEAPAASLKLARDPASISGKPLEIASPADVKPAKGQALVVKFAKQSLTPEMLKEDGAGLAVTLAAGCDAAVVTKEGVMAAFVPRKNASGDSVVHPIVPAETLAELLGGK